MFKRVIVATDLSPAAFSVVRNLHILKDFKIEHCLVLQCLSMTQAGSAGLYYTYSFFEQGLVEQKNLVEKQGFTAEARLIPGVAKSEISRIVSEEDYQLVVAGAAPSSLISAALMGGIGYELIHGMKNPVLLMRLEEKKTPDDSVLEPVRPDYLNHILFPSDFSATSNRAFETVKKLAIAGAKKITLMHVQDRERLDPYLINRLDEFNEIDEARMQAMKELLHEVSDVDVEIIIAFGNPSKEILTTIQEKDIQLVVMGSQGRGFMGDLFLGSVSHNVARHAASSVLLIPPSPIL